MKTIAVLPSLLLLFASVSVAQDAAAPPFKVPDDLMNKTNPVKPTPAGMEHARKMWGYDCSICHGAKGDGKGDIASSMKAPMKDYTDPASLAGMSDGQLYYIILKGKGEMPPEGDRGKPDDIWNMVSLVRSFARK
jgi:mono/diheme cytochrome c family protein